MRKEIVIIETEWDRRRERKERLTATEKKAIKKRQKAQGAKHRFIDRTAKKLRANTPKSEQWFNEILKQFKLDSLFLSNIQLNDLIPDFINLEHKIIIEIDGSIHWNNQKQLEKDKRKDEVYSSMGYRVFRVNHKDAVKAYQTIKEIRSIVQGDSVKRVMRAEKDHL